MTTTLKTILTLIIIQAGIFQANTQETAKKQESTKKIHKEFSVKENAEVSVSNRFGKIHCSVWDKNVVDIEVIITAQAPASREAERMLDRVNIDIKGNANEVSAVTTLTGKLQSGKETKLTIDYFIHMPRTLYLNLKNSFGDIYLDENSGSTKITIDYGNVQINRLAGTDHKLNMQFSKGTVNTAEHLSLDMNYSEFQADEIKELVLDSKFSTIDVARAGIIRQESQYDTNRLGETREFRTSSKFSTITVDRITESLTLDMRYGACSVKDIAPEFKAIDVTNSFGNVNLHFQTETSFKLEARSNFGQVHFPKMSNIRVDETSFTAKSYTGTIGKEDKPVRIVKIATQNGDVTLKMETSSADTKSSKITDYQVLYTHNMGSPRFVRTGDGNKVVFNYNDRAGTSSRSVSRASVSSGYQVRHRQDFRYESVDFPFEANINFIVHGMGPQTYNKELQFMINKPGNWEVYLDF